MCTTLYHHGIVLIHIPICVTINVEILSVDHHRVIIIRCPDTDYLEHVCIRISRVER